MIVWWFVCIMVVRCDSCKEKGEMEMGRKGKLLGNVVIRYCNVLMGAPDLFCSETIRFNLLFLYLYYANPAVILIPVSSYPCFCIS